MKTILFVLFHSKKFDGGLYVAGPESELEIDFEMPCKARPLPRHGPGGPGGKKSSCGGKGQS